MTPTELSIAALQEIGILASGEPIEPEDHQLVSAKYADLYDMLLSLNLVAWAPTEDVPDFAGTAIVMMLASVIAPSYGLTGQRLADLRIGGSVGLPQPSIAERQLRQALAKNYISYPVQSEYF